MNPRLRGRLLLAASFAVACTDARDSTPLAPERAPQSPQPVDPAPSAVFDRYSADVELTVTLPSRAKLRPGPKPQRYHVERTRDADNVWTTRMTFDRSNLSATASGGGLRVPTTIVRRDGESIPRFFDAAGRRIELPEGLAPGVGRLTPFPTRGAVNGGQQDPGASAAVDALVLASERRQHRLASIRRRLGAPITPSMVRGRSTYRSRFGEIEVESVVDDQLGAVLEETFTRGGKRIGHRRTELDRLSDGTVVVARIRSEHPVGDDPSNLIVVDHRYNNVTVRRGGQAQ